MKVYSVLLLALLAACAPAANRLDTSGLRSSELIRGFRPDKGAGTAYKVGEQVRFSFTLERAGYVTLLTSDSDGTTYDLERSVPIPAGAGVLPRPDDRNGVGAAAAYIVDLPTGTQRVILLYTDKPAPAGTRISGKFDNAALQKALRSSIAATKAERYDVAETSFEVKP